MPHPSDYLSVKSDCCGGSPVPAKEAMAKYEISTPHEQGRLAAQRVKEIS